MKEVQKLLKLVADGLKSLAQGVEAIADKVDDTAKTKSPAKADEIQQPTPVKTAKVESKPAEPVVSNPKTAGQPEKNAAPQAAEPVVSKAKSGGQPEKKAAPNAAEPVVSKAKTVAQPAKKAADKPAEPVAGKAKTEIKPEKKTASKPARKKTGKQPSAMDTVLEIISRSDEGVKSAAIKAETGFEQKKVSNIVYKLKKQGKVKALKKGVYIKS